MNPYLAGITVVIVVFIFYIQLRHQSRWTHFVAKMRNILLPGSHAPSVAVYKGNGKIFIWTISTTTQGLGIETEPMFCFGEDHNPSELGQAVLDCFAHSQNNIPGSVDYKKFSQARLTRMGCKSEKEFLKDCRSCQITVSKDTYTFIPMSNGGREGDSKGFRPIDERTFPIRKSSRVLEIGDALHRGLELSRGV